MAEDIVQDVFANIWQKENVNIIETEKSFLFQCTKNKCLEHLRREKIKTKYIEAQESDTASVSIEKDTELYMRKEKLFNSIRQLPPKCQEVFVMSKVNGLTYGEIAKQLDISIKTVENHIGKALRLLRASLAK